MARFILGGLKLVRSPGCLLCSKHIVSFASGLLSSESFNSCSIRCRREFYTSDLQLFRSGLTLDCNDTIRSGGVDSDVEGLSLIVERSTHPRHFILLKSERASELLNAFRNDRSCVSDNDVAHLAHYCAVKEANMSGKEAQRVSVVQELSGRLCNISDYYLSLILKLCSNLDFPEKKELALQCVGELANRGSGLIESHIGVATRTLVKLALFDQRMKNIIDKSILECKGFDIQDICQLVWGLTYAGHIQPSVADRLMEVMTSGGLLPSCTYNGLTTWLWYAGTGLSVVPNAFVEKLVEEVLRRPFQDELFSMTSWALGKRKQFSQPFHEKATSLVQSGSCSEWSPRLLSTFVWYLVCTYVYDKDLMDRISERALPKLLTFTEHDLALLVRSFGILNHSSPELMNTAAAELTKKAQPEFRSLGGSRNTRHSVLTTVWSCLVEGVYPRDLINHVMDRQSVECVVRSNNVYAASVLLQLDIASRLERPDLNLSTLPASLVRELVHICVRNSASVVVPSVFHRVVQRALTQLTGSLRCFLPEAHTYSPYRIDFELTVNDKCEPVIPPPGVWTCTGEQTLSSSSLHQLIGGLERPRPGDASATSPPVLPGTTLVLPTKTYYAVDKIDPLKSVGEFSPPYTTESLAGSDLNAKVFVEKIKPFLPSDTSVNMASDWTSPALPKGLHRVALEADGRYHYDRTSQHILGKTLLKQRQLKALGWKVLSIPYGEWSAWDKNATSEQVDYIREKLKSLEL